MVPKKKIEKLKKSNRIAILLDKIVKDITSIPSVYSLSSFFVNDPCYLVLSRI